ncbi:hypothetical protein E2C01_099615 [Portunus trituberculatus]|uniref:Uncharacterized protein n=1 Tax=Portunus trituberculatus TaxID=210409 RepID=A0A5B7KB82_PORTR|nr:hypothetical protein [Portunus trituberculatus]
MHPYIQTQDEGKLAGESWAGVYTRAVVERSHFRVDRLRIAGRGWAVRCSSPRCRLGRGGERGGSSEQRQKVQWGREVKSRKRCEK